MRPTQPMNVISVADVNKYCADNMPKFIELELPDAEVQRLNNEILETIFYARLVNKNGANRAPWAQCDPNDSIPGVIARKMGWRYLYNQAIKYLIEDYKAKGILFVKNIKTCMLEIRLTNKK